MFTPFTGNYTHLEVGDTVTFKSAYQQGIAVIDKIGGEGHHPASLIMTVTSSWSNFDGEPMVPGNCVICGSQQITGLWKPEL